MRLLDDWTLPEHLLVNVEEFGHVAIFLQIQGIFAPEIGEIGEIVGREIHGLQAFLWNMQPTMSRVGVVIQRPHFLILSDCVSQ